MKNLLSLVFILIAAVFSSCENEVNINTDFEEVTVIYGLLNQNTDTQFIKINKCQKIKKQIMVY